MKGSYPLLTRFDRDEATIAASHYGNVAATVDIVFVHANGLNAATYRNLFRHVSPDIHIMAIDQRGHGLTTLDGDASSGARTNWTDLRDDLATLLAQLKDRPHVLAGHSMGATVSLMTASTAPVADRLVLFEPVWPSPELIAASSMSSRHRRRHFSTREEAFARLQGRGAFKTWPEISLRDYLDTGLVQTKNGFDLRCSPEWESSNFATSDNRLSGCFATLHTQTNIFLADIESAWQPPAKEPVSDTVRIETVPGSTHFLPIESAAFAARKLTDAVISARRNRTI